MIWILARLPTLAENLHPPEHCASYEHFTHIYSTMVVATKQRVAFNNLLNIDVYLGADRLDQSNCIDYPGVKLDAHLTWNSQIDAVCKKLVFAIFRLRRLRDLIAPHIMLRIYQCIIQPILDYAITVWGFTSQLNLSRVQRLQNRAARIITGNFDYINVRGIDIVKRLKWINVIARRDYFVALIVFKCIRGMAPTYLWLHYYLHRSRYKGYKKCNINQLCNVTVWQSGYFQECIRVQKPIHMEYTT